MKYNINKGQPPYHLSAQKEPEYYLLNKVCPLCGEHYHNCRLPVELENDAQIAFGSDDNLYATSSSGTGSTIVSMLNPTTGTVISNEDHEVPGGGTVGDITKAPIQ